MNFQEKQLLTSRILFGAVRCRAGGTTYYLSSPSQFHVFVSNELYADCLSEVNSNLFSEEEIVRYLYSIGMWSVAEQEELDAFPKKFEEIKLELFDYIYRPTDFGLCKLRIQRMKERRAELLMRRHSFDYVTAEGFATFCRMNYLIGSGLKNSSYQNIWTDDGFLSDRSGLLDEIRLIYQNTRITESQLRELARSDPWRMYWSTCDQGNMFGRSPLELTEEQKNLIAWTKLYDSIFQSLETPEEKIIEDDDLLDAWLILQRKKRKEEKVERQREEMKISNNPKINNSQSIFLMVGEEKNPLNGKNIQMVRNLDEAKELDKIINDDRARAAKAARFRAIEQGGELTKHVNLTDVRQDLTIQYNNQIIDQRKQRGM